jgi:lipoate-protein ligase A
MTFYLIHLKNYPIYQQLQLEEALLRTDHRNYCIINEGSPPAIVMGISGKPQELIDLHKVQTDKIPIIKRFSGGGTVFVDEDTLFISLLCQKQIHDFPSYPEPIMRWTEGIYKNAFSIPEFHLRENDYVIGNNKCGGNAQYLSKNRWVHHSTFLWDFQQERMNYLLHPKKAPTYRAARSHEDFLCRLSHYYSNKEIFVKKFKIEMQKRYQIEEIPLHKILPFLESTHRKATNLLTFG